VSSYGSSSTAFIDAEPVIDLAEANESYEIDKQFILSSRDNSQIFFYVDNDDRLIAGRRRKAHFRSTNDKFSELLRKSFLQFSPNNEFEIHICDIEHYQEVFGFDRGSLIFLIVKVTYNFGFFSIESVDLLENKLQLNL